MIGYTLITNDPPAELYSYWKYCGHCKQYTYQRPYTGGFTCKDCYQGNAVFDKCEVRTGQ